MFRSNKIYFFMSNLFFLTLAASQSPALSAGYALNKKLCAQQSNEQALLKAKMCNTDFTDVTRRAHDKYRRWTFIALQRMGHPMPPIVMVLKEKNTANAQAGPMRICNGTTQLGRGISIDEEFHEQFSYGVQRLTAFHEAAHLAERHYAKRLPEDDKRYHEFRRANERRADEIAALQSNCYHCTHEYGCYYIEFPVESAFMAEKAKKKKSELSQEELKQIKTKSALHVEAIYKMDDFNLDTLTVTLQSKEAANNCLSTHPSDYERAVRMFKIARQQKNAKAVCSHHQKKEAVLIAQEKAAEKKRIIEAKKKQNEEIIKRKQKEAYAKAIEIDKIKKELKKKIHPSIKGFFKDHDFSDEAEKEYEKRKHGKQ